MEPITKYADNPAAVEEVVCQKMQSLKRTPVSDTVAKLILLLGRNADEEVKSLKDELEENCHIPVATILLKRESREFKTPVLDMRTAVLLLVHTQGRIGEALLYMYYIRYWVKKNDGLSMLQNIKKTFGNTEPFFTLLCLHIFPTGLISSEDMSQVWAAQKVSRTVALGSDNLIDYPDCIQSLYF